MWQNCPIVCGICCEDDPTFSFQIFEYSYSCAWVEQTQTEITYCNNDSGVFEACPKLCNNCRPNVVIPLTPPPATPQPTRSRSPSLIPTSSPSVSPTSRFSSSPTTSEPTTSPTRFCADDSTFFYIEEDRTCEFIDRKRKRRTRFCAEVEVRVGCPRTCGICNCRDMSSFRFTVKKKTRRCAWVGRKNNRINKFCSHGGKFIRVSVNCPETCRICRNPILFPTQSPTTSSPTVSSPPSLRPSVNPSTRPSPIPSLLREPSSVPTSLCLDDPHFFYLVQGRVCAFIGSQEFLREEYCPVTEVALNCPKTCGVCCNDDPSFRYLINSGESEACGFLTSSPSDTDERISKYCNHFQGVNEGCPQSCNNCPSSF